MNKSTIDSLVKLPLQIPVETGARSKKETGTRSLAIRAVIIEPGEKEPEKNIDELNQKETSLYPNGYIKYPAYDFF